MNITITQKPYIFHFQQWWVSSVTETEAIRFHGTCWHLRVPAIKKGRKWDGGSRQLEWGWGEWYSLWEWQQDCPDSGDTQIIWLEVASQFAKVYPLWGRTLLTIPLVARPQQQSQNPSPSRKGLSTPVPMAEDRNWGERPAIEIRWYCRVWGKCFSFCGTDFQSLS